MSYRILFYALLVASFIGLAADGYIFHQMLKKAMQRDVLDIASAALPEGIKIGDGLMARKKRIWESTIISAADRIRLPCAA